MTSRPHVPRTPLQIPQRPRSRRAVTIVAGFKCVDGVVLCADTQETLGNTKTDVPKVRLFPNNSGNDHADDLTMAFAGSGDSGPFIDKVVERIWEDVQVASSFDEVCIAADESIKKTHKEYRNIYQTGFLPDVKLVYGIKMQGQSKLFSSDGPTVNEKVSYDSHGSGDAIAKYIASQMYGYGSPLSQMIILAAYTVYMAKTHANGCGGATHIVKLANDGGSSFATTGEIKWIEDHIESLESYLGMAFLSNADLTVPDIEVDSLLEAFKMSLQEARIEHKKNKARRDEAIEIRKRATEASKKRAAEARKKEMEANQ